MTTTIKLVQTSGTTYTGTVGELFVYTPTNTIKIGGTNKQLAKKSDIPTKTSQLTDDTYWNKTNLTKLSQLNNNSGCITSAPDINKLTNDSNFITSYCTYCTYCS